MSGALELSYGQFLCFALVVAGTLGDVTTTLIDMSWLRVTREVNPAAIAMMNSFGLAGYVIVKLAVVVCATLFLLRLVNRILARNPKRPGHTTISHFTMAVSGSLGLFLLGVSAVNVLEGIIGLHYLHGVA